jgi:hypothetical protein
MTEHHARRAAAPERCRVPTVVLDDALPLENVDDGLEAIVCFHCDVGGGVDRRVVEESQSAKARLVRGRRVALRVERTDVLSVAIAQVLDETDLRAAPNVDGGVTHGFILDA